MPLNIIRTYQSPNYDERKNAQPIDTVIIHYTDMLSAEAALKLLCDPASKVSSHYLIDKEGLIYQLVDEHHRAWHAGVSSWKGETNINCRSVGIELDNRGHTHGPEPFPEKQIESLLDLLKDITDRYSIPANRILGHSDVAPLRKKDPGELFPWSRLAEKGYGILAK